jgi:hypothetical protein
MKLLSIILRVIWTGLAAWAIYSLDSSKPRDLPLWVIGSLLGLMAVAWLIVFVRLARPLNGIGAVVALAVVLWACGMSFATFLPGGAPDWTIAPFAALVLALWVIVLGLPDLLRRHPRAAKALTRVGYALVWLVAVVPSVTLAFVPWAVRFGQEESSPLDFGLDPYASPLAATRGPIPLWFCGLALATCFVVWLVILWRGVPLRWASGLMAAALVGWLFVLYTLPSVPVLIVGGIGLGKLVLQVVGRRNTLARSQLAVSGSAVSPRGLVEYEGYEQ